MNTTQIPYRQLIGMGILTGMRSSAAPALAGQVINNTLESAGGKHSASIPTHVIGNTLKLMALAEFLADKLPVTPGRVRPVSVAVRCISGAVVGAGLFSAAGSKASTGALWGAAIAGASTFGSFFLRKAVVEAGLGHFVANVIEDALIVGGAIKLIRAV